MTHNRATPDTSLEDVFLTETELSQWIKRSPASIRRDRRLRRGMPFIRVGRTIRYRRSSVLAFMAAHERQTGNVLHMEVR